MPTLDTIQRIYQLTVQGNDAVRELTKVNKSLDGLNNNFSKVGKAARAAFAFFGVGLSASFLKNIIETNSALAKQADLVGLSAERFQEYAYAAKLAGVDQNAFAGSLREFAKRIGEVQAGTGTLFSALQRTDKQLLQGLKNTKNQDEAFRLLADAIQDASSAAEKSVLADAAFGGGGVPLINALNQGSKGLDDLAKQARDLNLIVGEDLVRSAERYDAELTNLSERIKSTFGIGFLTIVKTTLDQSEVFFVSFSAAIQKIMLQVKATLVYDWEFIKRQVTTLIAQILTPQRKMIESLSELFPALKNVLDVLPSEAQAQVEFANATQKINSELENQLKILDDATLATIADIEKRNELRDAIARLNKQIKNQNDNLSDQQKFINSVIESAVKFDQQKIFDDAAIVELGKALNAGTISLAAYVEEMRKLGIVFDKSKGAQQEFIDSVLDAAVKFDQQKLFDDAAIVELGKALNAGTISLEAYKDGMKKLGIDFDETKEQTLSLAVAIGQTLEGAVDGLASAFIDFTKGGKDAFKNFAASVIDDIAKMIIKLNLLKIASAFTGGEVGGINVNKAKGGAFYHGQEFFAAGGVVNRATPFRMANGGVGVMGEAGPEAILPLRRGGNGNLGVEANVNVNVKNYAPGVDVTTQRDRNGQIEIIIAQIADRIRAGGNKLSTSFENTYGVSRAHGAI